MRTRTVIANRRNTATFAVVLGSLILAACQTATTQVERAARAKDLENAPYDNILVVGVTYRADTGRAFETVIVEELATYDTRARAYHRVVATTEVNEDTVRKAAEDIGADAVLVVTIEAVDPEITVGEARTDIKQTVQQGGRLVDFFQRDYEEIKSAPRIDMKYSVRIVSNFYDVEKDARVYTVESATAHAKTPEEVIRAESAAITLRMHKDDIIR